MKDKRIIWIIGLFFIALLASAAHAQVRSVLSVDGTDDSVDDPSFDISNDGVFTIGFWLKDTSTTDYFRWWVSSTNQAFGSNTVNVRECGYSGNGYPGEIELNCGTASTDCTSGLNGIWKGKWSYFTVIGDGNRCYLYYNGNHVLNVSFQNVDTEAGFYVGGYYQPTSVQYSEGYFDEVKVFNRNLSVNEIDSMYNQGLQHSISNVSSDNLTLYWPFDGDANDYSGNGNNGILKNDAHTTGFIIGNNSNITALGINNLEITLNSLSLLNDSYSGLNFVELKDGTNVIFNLNHDFSKSSIDLTKVKIEKTQDRIVFNFSDQFVPGDVHSFYLLNTGQGGYYCPYAKIISDISLGCSNAVSFTDAEAVAVTQKTIIGGIAAGSWVNVSVEGDYYRIMTNSTADDGGGGILNAVPEFSAITTILALMVVISGFLIIRKHN